MFIAEKLEKYKHKEKKHPYSHFHHLAFLDVAIYKILKLFCNLSFLHDSILLCCLLYKITFKYARVAHFRYMLLFFNKFIYFIYLILAALGLHCCAWAFSSCGKRGLLFVAVRGLLLAVASLVAEHGL